MTAKLCRLSGKNHYNPTDINRTQIMAMMQRIPYAYMTPQCDVEVLCVKLC